MISLHLRAVVVNQTRLKQISNPILKCETETEGIEDFLN